MWPPREAIPGSRQPSSVSVMLTIISPSAPPCSKSENTKAHKRKCQYETHNAKLDNRVHRVHTFLSLIFTISSSPIDRLPFWIIDILLHNFVGVTSFASCYRNPRLSSRNKPRVIVPISFYAIHLQHSCVPSAARCWSEPASISSSPPECLVERRVSLWSNAPTTTGIS